MSGGWLPIETAPRTSEPILVTDGTKVALVRWSEEWVQPTWSLDLGGDDECLSYRVRFARPLTHWQPAPKPAEAL